MLGYPDGSFLMERWFVPGSEWLWKLCFKKPNTVLQRPLQSAFYTRWRGTEWHVHCGWLKLTRIERFVVWARVRYRVPLLHWLRVYKHGISVLKREECNHPGEMVVVNPVFK